MKTMGHPCALILNIEGARDHSFKKLSSWFLKISTATVISTAAAAASTVAAAEEEEVIWSIIVFYLAL